jgi:Leucine Rich repeat
VLLRGAAARLPLLRSISLRWCAVGRGTLPQAIAERSRLQRLLLTRCEISDSAATSLQRLLANPQCALTTLELTRCHISAMGVRALAAGVGAAPQLHSVRLAGCAGGKAAALAFAGALRSSASLTSLNLACNRLTAGGAEALAAALAAAPRAAVHCTAAACGTAAGRRLLVVQRKEIGSAGLRSLLRALRRATKHTGALSLHVLARSSSGGSSGSSSGEGAIPAARPTADSSAAAAAATADADTAAPTLLALRELPVLFVAHEDQERLLGESWLAPALAALHQSHCAAAAQGSNGGGSGGCCCCCRCHGSSDGHEDESSSGSAIAAAGAAALSKAAGGGSLWCREQLNLCSGVVCPSRSWSSVKQHHVPLPAHAPQQQQQQQHDHVESDEQWDEERQQAGSQMTQVTPDQGGVDSQMTAARAGSPHVCSSSSSTCGGGSAQGDGDSGSGSSSGSGSGSSKCTSSSSGGGSSLPPSRPDSAGGGVDDTERGPPCCSSCCPLLVVLSQSPADCVAAALKAVEGLSDVEVGGIPLGNKVCCTGVALVL